MNLRRLVMVVAGLGLLSGCVAVPAQQVAVQELCFASAGEWPQPGEHFTLHGLYDPAANALRTVRIEGMSAQVNWYTLDRAPQPEAGYGTARVTAGGYASLTLDVWQPVPIDLDVIEATCERAVMLSGFSLRHVPWETLALPQYRDTTAAFRFAPAAALLPEVQVLGIDWDAQEALCMWQGPALPEQHPLVQRWVMLYPVYDLATGRVERLVITIEGELQE
jgi:hypothetical protein